MEETKKEIEELKKLLKLNDDDIKQIVKLTKPKSDYDLCCELCKIALDSQNVIFKEL